MRGLRIFVILLCTALAACGGSSGSGGSLTPSGPASTPTPIPTSSSPAAQSATVTFTAQATPSSVTMPVVNGYAGSLSLPAITGGGNISLTVSTQVPSGAQPLLRSMRGLRKGRTMTSASSSTQANLVLYLTLTPANSITIDGVPGFILSTPPSLGASGLNFYLAYYAVTGWQLSSAPGAFTSSGASVASSSVGAIPVPAGTPVSFAIIDTGPASFAIGTSSPLVMGIAGTVNVTATSYDGLGSQIIGPPATPISITSSDTTGRTSLGGSAISASTPSVPLTYDGDGDNFTLTAAQGNVTSTQTIVTRLPQETQITSPPGYAAELVLGPGNDFWVNTGTGVGYLSTSAQFAAFANPNSQEGSGSYFIVEGSDGNLWADYYNNFYEYTGINRVTSAGQFTSFPFTGTLKTSSSEVAGGMVLGPDGAVWFGLGSPDVGEPGIGIGRIDTSGNITQIAQTSTAPTNLVVGPDGNIWFSLGANVVKMTPGGTMTSYSLPGASSSVAPLRFIVGADGNLWAPYAYGTDTLLKFSTNGTVVSSTKLTYDPSWAPTYSTNAAPALGSLVKDGSGNIYATDVNAQGVIRITPAGTVSEYPTYSTLTEIVDYPMYLVVGADGNLYLESTAVLNFTQSGLVPALTKVSSSLW